MATKEKEIKWFKTPKALLVSDEYRSLSDEACRLLNHLLLLFNTFKRKKFFQYTNVLMRFTGMKYTKLLKAKKELKDKKELKIKIERKGNLWYYDLNECYQKYIKIKEYKVTE